MLLETPTWRANEDWGAVLGYDSTALDRINQESVRLLRHICSGAQVQLALVSGAIGPRGDGYVAGGTDAGGPPTATLARILLASPDPGANAPVTDAAMERG